LRRRRRLRDRLDSDTQHREERNHHGGHVTHAASLSEREVQRDESTPSATMAQVDLGEHALHEYADGCSSPTLTVLANRA
jgi:hypothetical protein